MLDDYDLIDDWNAIPGDPPKADAASGMFDDFDWIFDWNTNPGDLPKADVESGVPVPVATNHKAASACRFDWLLYLDPAGLARVATIGLPPTAVLHGAARYGHYEIVEQVLISGPMRAASISKALRLAASHGNLSVVELLVRKGASMTPAILRDAVPNVRAWVGARMMASAIRSHDFAAVVEMLASGVRPDTNQGAAALRWAAHYGLAQVVGALLRAGVDPRSERSLALRWALAAGHDAIAATLVAAGARLGDVDRSSVPESRLALLGM